jgi:STE24 endopeptidase
MGNFWWFWVWLFWLGFNLLALVLYPTVIAPLFNKFSPLADDALRQRIEALLSRCGFTSSGLFVMDGSKRSSHGNAYFTGFGRQKRIVFFDTLLNRLSPDEIEAVLAHELGHFRRRHIWKRLAVLALASLALLWLLGRLIDLPWFYQGLGVEGHSTAMALLLFSLVLPVFAFPFNPLLSALSRRHEYEADAYAARQTRAADLVAALVKLYRDNASTLTPDPLHSTFYDSHPPAALRIARLQAQ